MKKSITSYDVGTDHVAPVLSCSKRLVTGQLDSTLTYALVDLLLI